MPMDADLAVVFEGGAGVIDDVVVEQLHVAQLKVQQIIDALNGGAPNAQAVNAHGVESEKVKLTIHQRHNVRVIVVLEPRLHIVNGSIERLA